MRAGPVPRDEWGIFYLEDKIFPRIHPALPTQQAWLVYLHSENTGSLSSELDLALGFITTHFQTFEFNSHEAIGLLH